MGARGTDEEVCSAGGGGPDGGEHCDARMEGTGVSEVETGWGGNPYFEAVGFTRGGRLEGGFLMRGSWWGRRGLRDDEAGGIGVEEIEREGVADAAGAVDWDYVGHDCGCVEGEVRAAWRRLSW